MNVNKMKLIASVGGAGKPSASPSPVDMKHLVDICDTCASRNVLNGRIKPHATVFKTNDIRWHRGMCEVCLSYPVDIVSRPDITVWQLEKPTKDLTEPKL